MNLLTTIQNKQKNKQAYGLKIHKNKEFIFSKHVMSNSIKKIFEKPRKLNCNMIPVFLSS